MMLMSFCIIANVENLHQAFQVHQARGLLFIHLSSLNIQPPLMAEKEV